MPPRGSFMWRGPEVKRAYRKALNEGLFEVAEDLLSESGKLVPWQVGDLERSGETDVDKQSLQATVFYDMPYAEVQHEDTTLRHQTYKGTQRQAKYLEQPTKERAATFDEYLAEKLRKVTGD